MIIVLVLSVSACLQFLTAFFAFQLIRWTGRTLAWPLISVALLIMGVRRLVLLFDAIARGDLSQAYHASEWLGLLLSVLMLFGILKIRPLLIRLYESASRLRESEERYRLISTVSSDYMFSSQLKSDGTLHLVWVAGAFERITGYTYEEYVARGGWVASLHPDDREQDARDLAQLRQNRDLITEIRTINKGGEVRWNRVRAHPLWDPENQRLVGIYGGVDDVTERRLADEALRRSEARYRQLFEQNPIPMLIYERGTFRMRAVNDAFVSHYGYSREEALAMQLVDLYPEEEKGPIQQVANALSGYADVGNWHHLKKDGTIMSIIARSNDLVFAGKPARIAVIVDISPIKEVERKMVEEHDRLVDVLESMNDAFVSLDSNWCYTYVNANAGAIFGRDPKQLIGKNTWTEFPEGIGQPFQKNYERALREQVFIRMEEYYPPNDCWYENRIYPSKEGLAIFFTDVTERRKAALELERKQLELRAILEASTDLVLLADERGIIHASNGRLETLVKKSGEQLIGRSAREILPEAVFSSRLGQVRRVLETGRGTHIVDEIHDRWYETVIEPVADPDGEYRKVALFSRDITEQRKAEQLVQALNQTLEQRVNERTRQLEASNKELEAFSYSVSHDLRAPLRAIDGFSRIVQEDYGPLLDEEGRRLLGVIRTNSQRMGQLIDDLLSFSRVGRHELALLEVDMAGLARAVYFELTGEDERVSVDFRVGDLPSAWGDPALLRQVWHNLIGNAIKFTARAGVRRISVEAGVEGGMNVYRVSDTGVGFDMTYVDKLFGVFQRLHRQEDFPGTGVGLAIVQRIVARHGGRIWAEGTIGEGACFSFALPPMPPDSDPAAGMPPVSQGEGK